MPIFPKKVNDLVVLMVKMISGYQANAAIFAHADVPGMQTRLTLLNESITGVAVAETEA